MTIVCVPDQDSADLLEPLPGGAELVVWGMDDERPEGLDRTEFWIPPIEQPFDVAKISRLMPQLKIIQLTSAGIEDAQGKIPDGIQLCDARGVHSSAVAELVVLMVLALQRRLPDFLDSQRRGRWEAKQADDLRGKRVLIIGAGDVGENVATRLRSFGAVPVMVGATARDRVHATSELPDLLPSADMVVLTVPLTSKTRGMVDPTFLAQLPDGAIVINVARGKIVETDAILAELQSGRLRAGLDVVEPEPLPEGHPLWKAPNLILTPHAAGHIKASGPRAFDLVRDQLTRYIAGQDLINVVVGDY